MLAGSGQVTSDVRSPGRGGSPEGENRRTYGEDKPAGNGKLHPESQRNPGNTRTTTASQLFLIRCPVPLGFASSGIYIPLGASPRACGKHEPNAVM